MMMMNEPMISLCICIVRLDSIAARVEVYMGDFSSLV